MAGRGVAGPQNFRAVEAFGRGSNQFEQGKPRPYTKRKFQSTVPSSNHPFPACLSHGI